MTQPASTTTKISNINSDLSSPHKCVLCEKMSFQTEKLLHMHMLICRGKLEGSSTQIQGMITNIKEDNKQTELFPTRVSQNSQKKVQLIIREGSFFALMAKITPQAP